MTSPARLHFERVSAAEASASAAAAGDEVMSGSAHELMLYKLAQDKLRLKAIESITSKIAVKVELLPEYEAYIAGVLSERPGVRDDVVTTYMMWAIDAGEIAKALTVAEYVLAAGLPMPDQFNRSAPCLVAEEIADYYLLGLKSDRPVDLAAMAQTIAITEGRDMPDQVRAKMHKAIGFGLLASIGDLAEAGPDAADSLQAARESLQAAVELHDGTGVKKDIERIDRALKKLLPPAAE